MLVRTVIVFLALLLPAVAVTGVAGPGIDFDSEEHDFGEVVHSASPTTEFSFANTGDETLIIKKLRSSCGCTKGMKGSREIPPGGKSTIVARIYTEGLPPGPHGNTITVHSNDTKRPVVKLRLRYSVVRHISVAPETVATTLNERPDTVALVLTAKNHWKKPIVLTSEAEEGSNDGPLLVPSEVVVPAGEEVGFKLRIPVRTNKSSRYCAGIAWIRTSDPIEKRLRVRYVIRLPKPVEG